MSNVKRGAVRTPVRDSGGTLSHCGICAAGFPAAFTKIENFPDWGGDFARMTQVPLRPADSVAAVEKSDGAGRSGQTGQTE